MISGGGLGGFAAMFARTDQIVPIEQTAATDITIDETSPEFAANLQRLQD